MSFFVGLRRGFKIVTANENYSVWFWRYSIQLLDVLLIPPFPLDQEPQTELAAQLAQEFYNFDMPLHIVNNLAKLDFEVNVIIVIR